MSVAPPLLISSTKSATLGSLDSTSLIFTSAAAAPQLFAAPRVEAAVVVNTPVPLGQRP